MCFWEGRIYHPRYLPVFEISLRCSLEENRDKGLIEGRFRNFGEGIDNDDGSGAAELIYVDTLLSTW